MPLNGLVLKSGATSLSVTGGSDKTYTLDGITVLNGVHISDANADFRLRQGITAKYRPPRKLTNNTWSREKFSFVVNIPEEIAGVIENTTFRGELDVPPGSTKKLEALLSAGQIIGVANGASGFISTGSLA